MSLPNFFVIGAPRCGTSTLYDGLAQYPDIFMSPVKEPWFFSIGASTPPFNGPRDCYYRHLKGEEYERLFDSWSGQRVVGEASTDYLYSARALGSLQQEFGNARFIAILRHPADRAYSNFIQHVSQGREPCPSFGEALDAEGARERENWCHYWLYRSLGFYGRQLERYYRYLSKDQLRVFLFEDFHDAPNQVCREIFEFLEIDASFIPSFSEKERNPGMVPSSVFLQGFLTQPSILRTVVRSIIPSSLSARVLKLILTKRKLARPACMDADERRELLREYEDDMGMIESLTDLDLSRWRVSQEHWQSPRQSQVSVICQRPDNNTL